MSSEGSCPVLSRSSCGCGRVEFHHPVSSVRTQERRDDVGQRLCVVLRMRALQVGYPAETRGLPRVLLVWHQQVPPDAAVRLMPLGLGQMKCVAATRELRVALAQSRPGVRSGTR